MIRTAAAVALVTGAAGLVEGILLAIVLDPFGAGAAMRLVSLATFVVVYVGVGAVAGMLLGLPVHLIGRRFKMSPETAAAIVSGLIGIVYARAWVRTIAADIRIPIAAQASIIVCGLILFAGAGWLASHVVRRPALPASVVAITIVTSGFMLWPASRPEAIGPWPADASGAVDTRITQDPPPPPRNVLLIVADTLRADHLSLYGYERATSPELSRWARGGVTFANAIVAKTKTSPSVASIFTGTWPQTHGIVACRTVLPAGAVTLAEILRERGFATHSITANSNIGAAFGFDQGFESVDEIWGDPNVSDARGVTDHALSWLKTRRDSDQRRPFFLYLHYIDPHTPYAPPDPWARLFVDDEFAAKYAGIKVELGERSIGSIRPSARLPERTTDVGYYVSRYDGEIAFMDHHLGRLFAALREMGIERDTLVIFTADHGEALSEHEVYFSHGEFSYEDNARVPLVMVLPGRVRAGGTVSDVVEIGGIASTVLSALGSPPAPSMEVPGFWNLAFGLERPDPTAEPAAFVEAGAVTGALRTAIRTPRWKLIENPTGFDRRPGRWDARSVLDTNRKQKAFDLSRTGREHLSRFELYDLASDPGEKGNLDRAHPEVVGDLLWRLQAWRAQGAGHSRLRHAPLTDLPEEVIRNLRSLGYVN